MLIFRSSFVITTSALACVMQDAVRKTGSFNRRNVFAETALLVIFVRVVSLATLTSQENACYKFLEMGSVIYMKMVLSVVVATRVTLCQVLGV